MIILLLCGVWTIAIAICAAQFLIKALKTGVLIGRSSVGAQSIRLERQRNPGKYWYCISLMAVVVGIALYFGLVMLSAALQFAIEG